MTKVELTITPDYVSSWTIVDAIRELFQNALDQEKQNPANTAKWRYDMQTETLTISNAVSKLTYRSLLLGQTTKAGDASTIGQFGEGYKIATLVLLRNGLQVTFYNYRAREIWRPRFVKSRRFGTDILTFFIEKTSFWGTPPSADLVIEVTGLTVEEYFQLIVPANLHLRTDYSVIEETEYGTVVSIPGKVFVNGLYVCDYEPYTYGYNFKPEHIRLDRDRKMVSDFDLRWMASKMWSVSTQPDKVLELLKANATDVAYLSSMSLGYTMRELAAESFTQAYGPEAIPVTNQEELSQVPAGYTGVLVGRSYADLIKSSLSFVMPRPSAASPLVDLHAWFDGIVDKLSDEEVERFNAIMEELHNVVK